MAQQVSELRRSTTYQIRQNEALARLGERRRMLGLPDVVPKLCEHIVAREDRYCSEVRRM